MCASKSCITEPTDREESLGGRSRASEMSMDLDLDFFGQDLGFFAGFGLDLDLRSWVVPDLDLDLDLQIFF